MARTRSGSGVSAWALVIFGFGFFISLVLAIVFYSQLSGARQAEEQAQAKLRQYVSTSEESDPEIAELARSRGGTVIGQLLERNEQLRSKITTNADATLETIDAELQALNVDTALVQEVKALQTELAAREEQLQQARNDLKAANDRAQAAAKQMATLNESFDKSVNQLKQQASQTSAAFQGHQKQVQTMEQNLLKQVEDARKGEADKVTELQNRVAQLEQTKATLEAKIRQLSVRAEGIKPAEVITADGRIVSVVDEANKVYIDLGRKDQVVLGMTFEVFESGDLVKLEEDETVDDLRGKATIEVLEIAEDSAVARIVRRDRRATVNQGDQIINAVFDPRTSYKFFVYGDFDIDDLGETSEADRQRIESMVSRWGGKLADELTYDVDFVVLGQEPPTPDPLPPGTIDPMKIKAHVEAQRNFEKYQSIIGEARSLSIPVLNQNRFLSLVGYYQR